jgi:hypothetical protein
VFSGACGLATVHVFDGLQCTHRCTFLSDVNRGSSSWSVMLGFCNGRVAYLRSAPSVTVTTNPFVSGTLASRVNAEGESHSHNDVGRVSGRAVDSSSMGVGAGVDGVDGRVSVQAEALEVSLFREVFAAEGYHYDTNMSASCI